ncbi:MAG: ribosomal protein S18-alanine N-acetyltransferase [Gemmatimonadota bacterium]
MDVDFRIRLAQAEDAAALSGLERRCFSDPWSTGGFREALATAGGFGLLAASTASKEDHPLGYLIGRWLLDEGEVLNLAVAPEYRGVGIGRALLDAGLDHFRSCGVAEVFLEVRESNRHAQELYLANGFRPVGQRKSYYRSPREDALVFRRPLDPSA